MHTAFSHSSIARAHTFTELYTPVLSRWSQQPIAQEVKYSHQLFSGSAL